MLIDTLFLTDGVARKQLQQASFLPLRQTTGQFNSHTLASYSLATSSRILNGLNIRSWVSPKATSSNQTLGTQISRSWMRARLYCTRVPVFLSFGRIGAVSTSSFILCFLGVDFLLRSMSFSFRGPLARRYMNGKLLQPQTRHWPRFTKFAISCPALLLYLLYWYVLTTCIEVSMVLTLFLGALSGDTTLQEVGLITGLQYFSNFEEYQPVAASPI
jgi:hypothetical protein